MPVLVWYLRMSRIKVKSIGSELPENIIIFKSNIQERLDELINDIKQDNEYVYLVKVYFDEPTPAVNVSARLQSIHKAFTAAGVTNGVVVPCGYKFGDIEIVELVSEEIQQ